MIYISKNSCGKIHIFFLKIFLQSFFFSLFIFCSIVYIEVSFAAAAGAHDFGEREYFAVWLAAVLVLAAAPAVVPTPLYYFSLSSGSEPPLSLPHADLVEVASLRFLARKDSAAAAVEEFVGLGENSLYGAIAPVAVGLGTQHLLVGHRGTGNSCVFFSFYRASLFAAHFVKGPIMVL